MNPALLLSKERESWMYAAKSAVVFWRRVEADERISLDFRRIAEVNAELIGRLVVVQGGELQPMPSS